MKPIEDQNQAKRFPPLITIPFSEFRPESFRVVGFVASIPIHTPPNYTAEMRKMCARGSKNKIGTGTDGGTAKPREGRK